LLTKQLITVFLSLELILGFSFDSFNYAEAAAKVKTYKNCTALNKDYRGGVRPLCLGKTKYKPYVSKALYDANKKLDRDKDFIARER